MPSADPLAERAFGLVARRLIPLFVLGLVLMQIDRSNISFAALQLSKAHGLTAELFGLAAGIFFVGYALFELPSNMVLQRVAVNRWLGTLLLLWGGMTALQAFAPNATFLICIRFVLGAFEGGFLPGVIYVLTLWLPAAHRSRASALVTLAAPLGAIIGGPLAGSLLGLSVAGLAGWQCLFLIEGVATALYGLVFMAVIPRGPDKARWLPAPHRKALMDTLAAERATRAADHHNARTFAGALKKPAMWIYAMAYMIMAIGFYGILFWLPQIIQNGFPGLTTSENGFLSAIPFSCAALTLVLVGYTSDRTGDRRWHLVAFGLVSAAGLLLSNVFGNPVVAFVALCIAISCSLGYTGVFWSSPMTVLSAAAAAGGIAVINSIGNLGGFLGPYIAGLLTGSTHDFSRAVTFFAAALVVAGVIPTFFPKWFPNARTFGTGSTSELAERNEADSPA